MQAGRGQSCLAQPGEMLLQRGGVLALVTQPRQKVLGGSSALDLGAALQRLPRGRDDICERLGVERNALHVQEDAAGRQKPRDELIDRSLRLMWNMV
jgi:hypothetical protein